MDERVMWQHQQQLAWVEPLVFAQQFRHADMALLYSSLQESHSGRYSFLFTQPLATHRSSVWEDWPTTVATDSGLPQWVGFLGYGLREPNHTGAASPIVTAPMQFMRYARLWRFDHIARHIDAYTSEAARPDTVLPAIPPTHVHPPALRSIASNFTRAEYEAAVERTIECIRRGEFYQANITRKFYGQFAAAPDSWEMFCRLSVASPAPYSTYLCHEGQAILSSSPECFLRIDTTGIATTRPIKGSARRSINADDDARIRHALATSEKNHAENLMIVDLMRNDLSRVCESGSVTVSEQSGLYSYATIHHLISTIHGKKRPDCSVRDVLRACFPPGSMTGAPKIAAMGWCEAEERVERGLYSGALGWIGHECADFSVVIRTLILEGDRFEFQVGGGIVADSNPTDEWRETLAKARGILAALAVDEAVIASL